MREIKFRAIPNKDFMINENQKNTLNSIAYYTKGEFYDDTFIYGYLADGYIIGKTIEAGEEYFVPSYWIPVEKETIGQYTGLKDKVGKEIYEGDILQWEEGAKHYSGHWVVYDHTEFKLWNGKFHKTIIDPSWYEVIGNIWEDGDLLNDSE